MNTPALLIAVLAALPYAWSGSQPTGEPPAEIESIPLTPGLVIAGAQEAYRAGPVADRLAISVTSAAGRARSADVIVRIDATGDMPAFRLEFAESRSDASLVVSLSAGTLVAANSGNENDRWVMENVGAGLDEILSLLPPLPIPQLHLALGGAFDHPTPYTPDLAWESAETSQAQPPSDRVDIVLRGRGPLGAVTALFDAQTLRLRSFEAELQGERTLSILSEPVEPGTPADWPITTVGRTLVADLSDLSLQRGPITPGQFVPDIGDNTGWSLHAELEALAAAGSKAVALVLFRVSEEPLQLATAEAGARLALQAVGLTRAEGAAPAVVARPMAAIELAGAEGDWQALRERWAGEAMNGLMPGWATPGSTLDRFDPGAIAALVLVAPDRRLLAVIPLESRTDAEALAEEIAGKLNP
jgi:hypothetical protein